MEKSLASKSGKSCRSHLSQNTHIEFSLKRTKHASASQNRLADGVLLFERLFVDVTKSNFGVTHRMVSHGDVQRKLQRTVRRTDRDSM